MAKNKRTSGRTPKKGKRNRKDWRLVFLEELARTACVVHSAIKAKRSRTCVYETKDSDPEFARLWAEAIEIANESLDLEMRRRAVEGTLKPVFQRGKMVGKIREYSDTLLIFLAKAHNAKYRNLDSKVVVSGENGGPVKVAAALIDAKPDLEAFMAFMNDLPDEPDEPVEPEKA